MKGTDWKSRVDFFWKVGKFDSFFLKKQEACLQNRYYFPVTHTPPVKLP